MRPVTEPSTLLTFETTYVSFSYLWSFKPALLTLDEVRGVNNTSPTECILVVTISSTWSTVSFYSVHRNSRNEAFPDRAELYISGAGNFNLPQITMSPEPYAYYLNFLCETADIVCSSLV